MSVNSGFQQSDVDLNTFYLRRDLIQEGQLWVWGYNYTVGQLGTNESATKYSSPVLTYGGGRGWSTLPYSQAFAMKSAAAIKTDGSLWTWGNNASGQLGTNNTTSQSSPVQVIGTITSWKQVAGGSAGLNGYFIALSSAGQIWGWGNNNYSQLGDGTGTMKSSPVVIGGPATWKQISAGAQHAAAIKTDGTLWTWGRNLNGSNGDNTNTIRSSPVQTIATGTNWKQVSANMYSTLAIKTDGTLWVWGDNTFGVLGTNNGTSYSSPVQTVAGGSNWSSLPLGPMTQYVSGAIKTDGTLWMWGFNGQGQLAINNTTYQSSPVQTSTGGTNWTNRMSIGQNTLAIKQDGTLWTWGYNLNGTLGLGDTTNRSTPVQIGPYTTWKSVSVGYNASGPSMATLGINTYTITA